MTDIQTFSPSSSRDLLRQADEYIAREEPLPVDLQTRLLAAGFSDPSHFN